MLPSIRDIVGAPVAGVTARPVPSTGQFQALLRNLRLQPAATGAGRAAAVDTARTAALGRMGSPAATGAATLHTTHHLRQGAERAPSRVTASPRISRAIAGDVGTTRALAAGARAGESRTTRAREAAASALDARATRADEAQASAGADGAAVERATGPSAAWLGRLAAMRPDYSRPAGTVRPLRGEAREALVQAIEAASGEAGLDPALSVAVARAESSLDPTARSFDGKSVGTFQVTAATAAEMRRKIARGDVERLPGHDDVALGVGYLRYLHDLFSESRRLGRGLETVAVGDADERRLFAVAAYNAGEGRVAQAQARAESAGLDPTRFAHVKPFLPSITRAYVDRVRQFADESAADVA